MLTVRLDRVATAAVRKKPVEVCTATHVIDESTLIQTAEGKFIGLYLADLPLGSSGETFYQIKKWAGNHRKSGIYSTSEIFGSAPRDPVRRSIARRCAFNRESPHVFAKLIELGIRARDLFKDLPEFESQMKAVSPISPYWLMPDKTFTSGIINNSNQLFYHRDSGNMPGTFSAMYTFRRGIREGYLHLPEYDALIKNENNSLLLFDGASVLHGVTPFEYATPNAKRITIVYYVLALMARCCANEAEEVKFSNKRTTEHFA
jgi:hypothetical protein